MTAFATVAPLLSGAVKHSEYVVMVDGNCLGSPFRGWTKDAALPIAGAINVAHLAAVAGACKPLLDVLRAVEWVDNDWTGAKFCPSCLQKHGDDGGYGHLSTCALAAALRGPS